MNWLKAHWKTIAGAACGVVAVGVGTVNPVAGLAVGAVCGAAFGRDATVLGQKLAQLVADLGKSGDDKKGK